MLPFENGLEYWNANVVVVVVVVVIYYTFAAIRPNCHYTQ